MTTENLTQVSQRLVYRGWLRNLLGVSLKEKLKKKDLKAREDAFNRAEKFIDRCEGAGGVDADERRTFMVNGTKHERVDIEVRAGKAFTKE